MQIRNYVVIDVFCGALAATRRISRDVICDVTEVDEDDNGDDETDEVTMD